VKRDFHIDVTKGLEPYEMENILHHPAVIASAILVQSDAKKSTEVATIAEMILESLVGHSPTAALMGCLQALSILAANMEAEAEREKVRKRMSLVRVMPE